APSARGAVVEPPAIHAVDVAATQHHVHGVGQAVRPLRGLPRSVRQHRLPEAAVRSQLMSDYNVEKQGSLAYIDQWDTDPEPKHYVRQVGASFIPVTPEFHEYLIATVGDAKAKDILNASAVFAYARKLEPWDT